MSNSPAPEDIKKLREKAGLTQKQAGELIHSTQESWQQWEYGRRKMHPAMWELFLIKTGETE